MFFVPYDPEDRWEYKIVRARHGEFADRRHLHAVIQREARAGWRMIEKYDDHRLLFRRPRHARARDHHLPPGISPYQSEYRSEEHSNVWAMVVLSVCVAVGLGMILTLALVSAWLLTP